MLPKNISEGAAIAGPKSVRNLFSPMIRVLHHIAEPQLALKQIHRVLQQDASFILEYANKQNMKAILRYLLGRQDWNPFSTESVEFVPLNYDFHPRTVRNWLAEIGFELQRQLTVSHFRIGALKRIVPVRLLVAMDSVAQLTGDWWQLTPSVFTRSQVVGDSPPGSPETFFRCPNCSQDLRDEDDQAINCASCGAEWPIVDGIYDFRGR